MKTFWKNEFEHVKNSFLKTLYTVFDWLKNRFDWSKMLRLIQYQSSIDRNNRGWLKILIAILIDRKTGSIDRNSRKNRFLKNQSKFVQKLLKALKLMNKMHEYEMTCFSKTQVLNPVFPTLRFSIHSIKFSSIKYVLHKTHGIFKLGWSNQKHTQ